MNEATDHMQSASDAVWEAMLGLGPMASDFESYDERACVVRLCVGATPGTITVRAFSIDDLWRLPYGIAPPVPADRVCPLPADLAHVLLGCGVWKVAIGLRTGHVLPRDRVAGLTASRSNTATWALTERLTATNTWIGEVGGDLHPDIELPMKGQRLILLEWCRQITTTEIHLSRAMRGPNRKSSRRARKAAGGARKDRRTWARHLRRGRSEIETLLRCLSGGLDLPDRPVDIVPTSRRIAPVVSTGTATDIFADSVIELARSVAYGDESMVCGASTSIWTICSNFLDAADNLIVLNVEGDRSTIRRHTFRRWCPMDRVDGIRVAEIDAEMLAFAIDAINETLADRLRKRSFIERAFGGIELESAGEDARWLADLKTILAAENGEVSRS